MYAITTTPGFIIESRPSGEAGKLLSIFTRDLGLVLATAQGIRLEKSKLRYHSQEYSFGEFSFVRGKEFWRLTNAAGLQSDKKVVTLPSQQKGPHHVTAADELIARIALLLRRLLHGEEAHPELFEQIQEAFLFLEESVELTPEQLQTLESLLVFRIMHLLGYIGTDKGLDQGLISSPITLDLITTAEPQRLNLNKHINKALRESHL